MPASRRRLYTILPPSLLKPDISKYDAVIFDLFHTLVGLTNVVAPALRAWEYLGIAEQRWRNALFNNAENRLRGKVTDPNEVIRDIVCKIDPTITHEKTERASRLRLQQFESVLSRIDSQVLDVIRELKKQGKALGLISNADRIEVHSWSRSEISAYFDSAVFSCHTGYVKPEREIYTHSLSQLNLHSGQCLFIGDGGNNELEGAKNVGMDTAITLQFSDDPTAASVLRRRAQADFEIRHISDLLHDEEATTES